MSRTAPAHLPIVRDHAPLEIRRGGGSIMIFGAVLFMPGAALLVLAAQGKIPAGLSVLGGAFAMVGIILTCGRMGTTLDNASGILTTWWGLLVPWKSRTRDLAAFNTVQLNRERHGSGKNARIVYPVRLGSGLSAGPDSVTLILLGNYIKARAQAEQVARHLQLPMSDRTDGEVLRQPDELDLSAAQRLRRDDRRIEWPGDPGDPRIVCVRRERDLDITLPPSGLLPIHVLIIGVMVPSSLMVMGMIYVFTRGMSGGFVGIIMGFEMLMTAGIVGACVVMARSRTQVTLNASELTIRRHYCGLTTTARFPVDALEELAVQDPQKDRFERPLLLAPPPFLLLRSDERSCLVGRGLAIAELAWLQQAIESSLCKDR